MVNKYTMSLIIQYGYNSTNILHKIAIGLLLEDIWIWYRCMITIASQWYGIRKCIIKNLYRVGIAIINSPIILYTRDGIQ